MQRIHRTTVGLLMAATILGIHAAPEATGGEQWSEAVTDQAQTAPGPGQSPRDSTPGGGPPPQARVFTADVGMLVNYIKPDKTADFEAIVQKLKEALAKSENPTRRAQAAGWRVLKLAEPLPNGNAVYVFLIDPATKDADYSPSRILGEVFPDEIDGLFKRYQECFAGGVSLANYRVIADMK
jgi:hypothetical protein